MRADTCGVRALHHSKAHRVPVHTSEMSFERLGFLCKVEKSHAVLEGGFARWTALR